MTDQTFGLDVAAKIEQDAIYGALALVELSQRTSWIPVKGEPSPWEDAARGLLALLRLSGIDMIEAASVLTDRMIDLQSRAVLRGEATRDE